MPRTRRLSGGIAATLLAGAIVMVSCARGDATPTDLSDAEAPDVVRPEVDAVADSGLAEASGDNCTRKIVLNEVMTHGATAGTEFVELYNTGTCAVSIAGWRIAYHSKNDVPGTPLVSAFDPGTTIAGQAFFLVATGGADASTADYAMTAGMADDGQIALIDDGMKIVDAVGWGTGGEYTEKNPAPAPPVNGSIGRKKDGADTDDNSKDWAAFTAPTPRAKN